MLRYARNNEEAGLNIQTKICGLSTPDTLGAALAGGASQVGFVFFPPSPRNLTLDQAIALAARVPAHVGRVGVFVDPDDLLIDAIAAVNLDVLQLHKTSAARAAAIRARTGLTVWQAIPVKTRSDLGEAARYRGAADRIIYDARTPDSAALPGGMGLRFDWKLLDGFAHPLPWGLSGGLDASNVAEAATVTGATMVDVSSGVESAPGIKDTNKIASFLRAVANL